MKLTLLGTGTPTPSLKRASSGYMLEIGRTSYCSTTGPVHITGCWKAASVQWMSPICSSAICTTTIARILSGYSSRAGIKVRTVYPTQGLRTAAGQAHVRAALRSRWRVCAGLERAHQASGLNRYIRCTRRQAAAEMAAAGDHRVDRPRSSQGQWMDAEDCAVFTCSALSRVLRVSDRQR